MAAATLFVTGTDTGVGKTLTACALIHAARAAGLRVAPFKPVASGSEPRDGMLRNDDALKLLAAAGGDYEYDDVNPYCFTSAIAPHLAAREVGVRIDRGRLDAAHAKLAAVADLVVVEGAGGWRVPLDDAFTFADWVGAHAWPVLLVVGMRLGCINHALLSAEAIARRTRLAGWVANRLPPVMDRLADNEATLQVLLQLAPCGTIPCGAGAEMAAPGFDWERIGAALRNASRIGAPGSFTDGTSAT